MSESTPWYNKKILELRVWHWIAAIVIAAIAITGLVFLSNPRSADPTLQQVAAQCQAATQLSDNGQSLKFKLSRQGPSDSIESLNCVSLALHVPQDVSLRFVSTSPEDNTQFASWDRYNAQWDYNNEGQLEVIIRVDE